MAVANRIPCCLFVLRVGVFIVMFMWTLDKFVNPDHAAKVYAFFFAIGGLGATAFYVIGGLELLVILAFVAGLFKRFTYALVLLLHAGSTSRRGGSTWTRSRSSCSSPPGRCWLPA